MASVRILAENIIVGVIGIDAESAARFACLQERSPPAKKTEGIPFAAAK